MEIILCKTDEQRDQIKLICKKTDNPTVRSFPNIWERFGNWNKNPPYVVVIDGKVVGFMGFTINKNEYINFYDFAILEEYQRKGIGFALWNKCMEVAHENEKTRIKTSAHEEHNGFHFFSKKLNWKPIARKGKEYKFDAYIEGVKSAEEFVNCDKFKKIPSLKEMARYLSMDGCFIEEIIVKKTNSLNYWLKKKEEN